MSFYDSADAIYGTGQYGSASYGVVSAVVPITGVQATGSTRHIHLVGFAINIHDYPYGVGATSSLGTIKFNVKEAASSVSATASLGTTRANLTKAVDGFGLTASLGTIDTAITLFFSSVAAAGAVNDNWDIRSINYISVDGVGATISIGDVDAGAAEPLSSVQAQGYIGTPYVSKATTKLTPVVATVQVGTLTEAHDTNYPISGVSAAGLVNQVVENPSEAIDSVFATLQLGTIQVNTDESLLSVSSQVYIGSLSVSGITRTFYADKYSRSRATILSPRLTSRRAA